MFGPSKDNIVKDAVFYERLRTIFILSRTLSKPITVLLQRPQDRLSDGRIVHGIVTYLGINGASSTPIHKKYLEGVFSLGTLDSNGKESIFNFSEVQYISLHYHSDPFELAKHEETINELQHLIPFTGFGDIKSKSNESYYYNFLTKMMN